jgi:hypothetical protein
LSTRQKVADSFEQFTSKVASEFVNKLPNHNAAREIILGYMAPVRRYPYCTKCTSLVFNGRSHKQRQHATFCMELKYGHTSNVWSEKNPKVLSCDFDVTDSTNYCPRYIPWFFFKVQSCECSTLCTIFLSQVQS